MVARTVDIAEDVTKALRKFRFQRRSQGNAAIVIKINKAALNMVVDEEYDNISIEDLVEELPRNSPRYVVLSYELKHDDGRTSFPLVFVNWAPSSCEITMMTLHASALLDFERVAEANKTIEVRDADEGLTKEIVDAKLLST